MSPLNRHRVKHLDPVDFTGVLDEKRYFLSFTKRVDL